MWAFTVGLFFSNVADAAPKRRLPIVRGCAIAILAVSLLVEINGLLFDAGYIFAYGFPATCLAYSMAFIHRDRSGSAPVGRIFLFLTLTFIATVALRPIASDVHLHLAKDTYIEFAQNELEKTNPDDRKRSTTILGSKFDGISYCGQTVTFPAAFELSVANLELDHTTGSTREFSAEYGGCSDGPSEASLTPNGG